MTINKTIKSQRDDRVSPLATNSTRNRAECGWQPLIPDNKQDPESANNRDVLHLIT